MASSIGSSVWFKVAGLVGASGVALAAYGAHGFKPADAHFAGVYKRANQQQMYHAALLAVAPVTKWVAFCLLSDRAGVWGLFCSLRKLTGSFGESRCQGTCYCGDTMTPTRCIGNAQHQQLLQQFSAGPRRAPHPPSGTQSG